MGNFPFQCLYHRRNLSDGTWQFPCIRTDLRDLRKSDGVKCQRDHGADDQYKLHQHVHFPCICNTLSGYAGYAVFHHPNQDEVACSSGCGSACGRRSAGRSDHTDRDHRIAFELYYFLFLQPESAWTQSETGCPQKEIPEADKPSAESVCRRCKAQMCSVRSYGT